MSALKGYSGFPWDFLIYIARSQKTEVSVSRRNFKSQLQLVSFGV